MEHLVSNEALDLIDICTSNNLHAPIALAAIKAGKNVLCEKPMAMSVTEALDMYKAAESAGIIHMMIFNYRFVPALAWVKRIIAEGQLGKIHHFNAVYYQDWLVDPKFPVTWRHNVKETGSGAHGDMNAHIIDLARFLVGEFEAVTGLQEIFIKVRLLSSGEGTGKVTADDTILFMAKFKNGAVGSFNCTRFANGFKNHLRLEIFGSKGSLTFNLERMNELNYFSGNDQKDQQGFRNILVTESKHPFINAWWPPGHIIGWEHSFTNQFAQLKEGIVIKKQVTPNFYDGLRCQQVLEGAVTQQIEESGSAFRNTENIL